MDECANWCWAFHCIWKPHIQWQLRRFCGTGEKEQQADNRCRYRWDAPLCYLVEDSYITIAIRKVVERPIVFEDEEDGNHQAKVADDIDNQGLLCSSNCSASLIPETNEKERCQANQPPTYEQKEKVVCADKQYHRKNKKVHVTEESPETWIILHISRRIDMNKEADTRNHHQHDCRQRIKQQSKANSEWSYPHCYTRIYPRVIHLIAKAC